MTKCQKQQQQNQISRRGKLLLQFFLYTTNSRHFLWKLITAKNLIQFFNWTYTVWTCFCDARNFYQKRRRKETKTLFLPILNEYWNWENTESDRITDKHTHLFLQNKNEGFEVSQAFCCKIESQEFWRKENEPRLETMNLL